MNQLIPTMVCGLWLAIASEAGEASGASFDVVEPRVPDQLRRVTLNGQELGGEIDRRLRNLIYMLRWIDSLLRLERTLYNALFAANSPDGRWIRYFTPFTGPRTYDTRDFFCCCGDYRRAVAELPQKVYYRTPAGGIALNLFTPSKKVFDVKGQTVTLRQETVYPTDGEVKLTFSTEKPIAFPFQFRTPAWCEAVTLRVNNEPAVTLDPPRQKLGSHVLDRTWKDGDVVSISMPMP